MWTNVRRQLPQRKVSCADANTTTRTQQLLAIDLSCFLKKARYIYMHFFRSEDWKYDCKAKLSSFQQRRNGDIKVHCFPCKHHSRGENVIEKAKRVAVSPILLLACLFELPSLHNISHSLSLSRCIDYSKDQVQRQRHCTSLCEEKIYKIKQSNISGVAVRHHTIYGVINCPHTHTHTYIYIYTYLFIYRYIYIHIQT